MPGWNESAWFSIFVSWSLKSTVVLGAAWLAAWALRGRSAALRHLVWTAAAAAVLALPLLSVSLPALRVPASGAFLPFDPSVMFSSAAAAGAEATVANAPAAGRAARDVPAPARHYDWRIWLMSLWAAGAAAAIMRMLAALIAMRRLERTARPFADDGLARRLAEVLEIRHEVRVLESCPGGMPMTLGLRRPAIFMPPEAAEWSQERRCIVLLHELAHVRRGDAATHLLARAALSLNWWNPLAWSAWREFLKDRERATDDLVLSAGARASDYAGHLLEVARAMQSVPATAWAAVAMARRSEIEGRLLAILDSGVQRHAPGRLAALTAILLAIAAVAPFAAMRAQGQAAQTVPPDVDATIRAAMAQKNHEMLEKAASAFEELKKYAEAQKLREASLAIRAEVSGEQSLDYAVGLVKLGDLVRQRGRLGEAEGYYSKAVAAAGDRPETATALLHLGIGEFAKKNYAGALDYFQRAQNVAPPGPLAGPATTWQATVKQHQEGQAPAAESLYQSALAVEDSNSPDAALTMELLAHFLREQGRVSEAEAMEARASEIRKAHVAQLSPKHEAMADAVKAGGRVTFPTLIFKLEPSYSAEARAARIAGTVRLSVVIGTDGKAYDFQLRNGMGYGLDEEAVKAITQWTFKPGARDGIAVPVQATIEVNFRLM